MKTAILSVFVILFGFVIVVFFFGNSSTNHARLEITSRALQVEGEQHRHNERHHHRKQHDGHIDFKKVHRHPGIYILPVPNGTYTIDQEWNIPMPEKSFFAGFPAPKDEQKWRIAQLQASRGEQILLQELLEEVRSPFDMFRTEKNFKWIQEVTESHKSKDTGWLNDMIHIRGSRAPLTLLGFRRYANNMNEGDMQSHHSMGPSEILDHKDFKIPRKIVGVGCMDENWGWLSSYFLNRTVPWALTLHGTDNPLSPQYKYCNDNMQKFLDDPNLVALFVNQHHNCTHPKIISLPLGVRNHKEVWMTIQKAVHSGVKKDTLFFFAGSDYAFRPMIRDCIKANMGKDMTASTDRLSQSGFQMKLVSSRAVLALPGLGYDTYRLWEALFSGSMPVAERGFGMDRTFYRLPVLLVDDFADLNPVLLKQAYVEALYLHDQWEYSRITQQYWERLMYEVADSGSIDALLRQHPMSAEDPNFTRPIVPFDCKAIGGCGPNTKRTPKKSCAIDPKNIDSNYNWRWHM